VSDPDSALGPFAPLAPQLVLQVVEQVYSLRLDGTITPFSSYVNRVYGIRSTDGDEYVVKFYRPGRWNPEAVAEEHEFVLDCARGELPVVAPLTDSEGYTLELIDAGEQEYACALYPKRGGRGFDAERDEDWFRLGALAGRVHTVGAAGTFTERIICLPSQSTARFVGEIREAGVVHPEVAPEFFAAAEEGLAAIEPLFKDVPMQRIHGDFHRGNVLERGDEGLLLIDFDDTMLGPVVQDLWLLLPGYVEEVGRELTHILEGYRQFAPFDERWLELIEPLRFMRMLYYLAWNAIQRSDSQFLRHNPDWGSRAFWIRELEDLKTQLRRLL
jgi:Ser/Thr protein kinase RdoA (MazF antagonist)